MPTRYLKPGICDSDAIDKTSPLAETLWYRLLVNVDDFGRMDARPAVVRSKCWPLKDSITNADTLKTLIELQACGLIFIYESNGCSYLQMQKWDNVPRAKESKCPAFDDTCIHLHADVCGGNTVLPVTVTVTVTETVNRKPETENRNAAFALPDWIDKTQWDLWMKTRKGKKMIAEQMQAQVNKLDGWRTQGLDHCGALANAAANGYTGLFLPDSKKLTVSKESDNAQVKAAAYKRLFGGVENEAV